MEDKYVITVARGFGTGGKQIALKLAKYLGIECYEQRILAYASQKLGLAAGEVADADERLSGSYISRQLARLQYSFLPKPMINNFISDDELFECQADIIRRLYQEGPCVIVGKCADDILKDEKNVISIYIEAPRLFCRSRIMSRMGVSTDEADHLIEKTDKYRAEYYRYYTHGKKWNNPTNYAMVLNSEKIGVDDCVRLILDYMRLKLPDANIPNTEIIPDVMP